MHGMSDTPGNTSRSTDSYHRSGHESAGGGAYYCPQCLRSVQVDALRRQRYRQRGIASTLLLCPICRLVLEAMPDAIV
jgi:hypothetical protein